jgi:hypothetical protein
MAVFCITDLDFSIHYVDRLLCLVLDILGLFVMSLFIIKLLSAGYICRRMCDFYIPIVKEIRYAL